MQDKEIISAGKFLSKRNELNDDEKLIMAQYNNINKLSKPNPDKHIQRQYDMLKPKLDALRS